MGFAAGKVDTMTVTWGKGTTIDDPEESSCAELLKKTKF